MYFSQVTTTDNKFVVGSHSILSNKMILSKLLYNGIIIEDEWSSAKIKGIIFTKGEYYDLDEMYDENQGECYQD